MFKKQDLLERFWRFVLKQENGCWYWIGAVNHKGYGKMTVDKKTVTAHKIAFTLFKGKVPEGMLLRHTCDTRNCVNPEHLLTGTNTDNWKDAKHRKTRDTCFVFVNKQQYPRRDI